jgi:hypothetical protein
VKRLVGALAAAAVIAACSSDDATGVDADAIDAGELAAVRGALDRALSDVPLYPELTLLVFPFIDRASHLIDASGDTTRLIAIELDIDVTTGEGPLDADFTTLLGWTDYQPATRTVDSVFFVAAQGRAPMNDALAASFSPDVPGSATGFVVHQAADSTTTVWQTGTGQVMSTSSTYGGGTARSSGGLTVTVYRGTLNGSFQITTTYRQPDAAPSDVTTAKNYATGTRAMKVEIRGTL